MKNNRRNPYLVGGLVCTAIVFGVGRFVNLPSFLEGLCTGVGLVLILVGSSDSERLKKYKKRFLGIGG